jgi:Protein of unknown function (DUF1588)/Protein of unknown function (DUF1592)/Protein of unknown function (DUF1595)
MRYSKPLFIFVSTFATATAFQNCAPGFQAARLGGSNSMSSESQLDSDDQNRLLGKAVYDAQCLSCHGQLESSQKLGASFNAIKSAIHDVGQMQSLSINDQDISLIEIALSPRATGALKFACNDTAARGLSNKAIRRMSTPEISNTLRSVLGDAVAGDLQIADQLTNLPSDSIVSEVDDYTDVPRAEVLFALQKIAKRVVELTDSVEATRTTLFGACSKEASVTDACAAAFVTNFGQKVYRRPLNADESASLLKSYTGGGKNLKGLQSTLFVLLQSPQLVMHIEDGKSVSGARVRLTDYEVASRISYMTVSAPPDAALMKAAETGQLQEIANVKTHVARLLSATNADAKNRIAGFMTYYAGLSSLEQPRASVGLASGINTTGLGDQMLRELSDYTDSVFWRQNGSFVDLMTSTDSFPRSDAMMKILGASTKVGGDGRPVKSDLAHMGLLHRPAYLASAADRTSPILRGVAVRREILCTKIPDPPAGDADEKLAELEALDDMPNRARIDKLTSSAACIGCHAMINPLGHLFENYNQLGQLRSEEVIYNDAGAVTKKWEVDTNVLAPKLDPDEPSSTALTDSIALTKAIANGKTARACFVQKAFEFVRARHMNEAQDGCALREAEKKVQTGSLRDVLIESIANEDIFWRSNQ